MALTKIGTDGVKDDAITSGKIPANAVGSSEIADQAVTLAKLEHGTSSNDGKFLRANNGADPTFETVTGTTINNNADNRVITGSGTANTLNGESNVVIDADGNVGIGTSSPNAFSNYTTLTINGGSDGAGIDLELSDNNIYGRFFADTTGLQIQSAQSGDSIRFETNGSNVRARITDDGLCFGSDSAAANALDDYEEGTYTPTFASGMSGISYTVQSGNYVKIGKLVRFDFYIQVNGGVSNGSMIEFNLPFTSAAGTNSHRGSGVITYHNINNGNSGSIGFPALYIGTSSAQCYMGGTQWTATSGSSQSNRYFIGGGTFHAA